MSRLIAHFIEEKQSWGKKPTDAWKGAHRCCGPEAGVDCVPVDVAIVRVVIRPQKINPPRKELTKTGSTLP
jgi:hypothetical protein